MSHGLKAFRGNQVYEWLWLKGAHDFGEMTNILSGLADKYCDGRIVSVLEGGYNPLALRDCVKIHLEELAK